MTISFFRLFQQSFNYRYIYILLLLLSYNQSISADNTIFKNMIPSQEIIYVIELTNGDVFTGTIEEFVHNQEDGDGIKMKTELGKATIFASQIDVIRTIDEYYRHNHRIFLLPTAEPISNNHFIGDFEGLFLYAGTGIGDIFSITAGRSIVPGISSKEQISELNVKFTVFSDEIKDISKKISVAVGGNMAFINSDNRFIHIYGAGSIRFTKSLITATIFYKAGSKDFYNVSAYNNLFDINYSDGSFGLAGGLDSRLFSNQNVHIIGEIWNSDITRPSNSGVFLGLRLCSRQFSADFGFSFFTEPFVAPFMSFVWTPF
jgi:hypothetical protein